MRWTLITGGARTLGAAIARTLAREGRHCVLHYRHSRREAEELQRELLEMGVCAETIQGDFSSIASTQALISDYLARFEETEALINNVGNYARGSATQTLPETAQTIFQVNVVAPLMLSQALFPALKRCRGHIVNMGMAGVEHPFANTHATLYNMTKQSLVMLTRSLAKELAPFQVAVNMVSPGYLENSVDLPKDPQSIPWGRPGTLEEVAEAVRFLLAPGTGYITGQNLEVSGGTRL